MGKTDVWLTRNGGYIWQKVGTGAHHYAIGDHGNLIVMYPRLDSRGTTLKYSVDQGKCWSTLDFADAANPLVVRQLVTEPESVTRTFSLWGYSSKQKSMQREWAVVTVNFHGMFDRKCMGEDFEYWYPHTENGKGGCLLGRNVTYKRPKDLASCYIGGVWNPVVSTKKCPCTFDDLECDFGFVREHGKCVHNDQAFNAEVCKSGEEFEVEFTGQRLIPGDECESKTAIKDVKKFIDTHEKCGNAYPYKESVTKKKAKTDPPPSTRGDKETPAATKTITDNHVEPEVNAEQQKQDAMHTTGKHVGLIIFAVMVLSVGLVLAGYAIVKKVRARRQPTFRMTSLISDESDDESNILNHYQDEEEQDDDQLIPL